MLYPWFIVDVPIRLKVFCMPIKYNKSYYSYQIYNNIPACKANNKLIRIGNTLN